MVRSVPSRCMSRFGRFLMLALSVLLAASSCAPWFAASGRTRLPAAEVPTVQVRVTDESGAPISGATVAGDGASQPTAADGTAVVRLASGPVLLTVSAPGHLSEPVPVGPDDAGRPMSVRLLSDMGGRRLVFHAGGDVMFGRRYEEGSGGTPLIRPDAPGAGAEQVVDALAPAFRMADLRTVNLESVVSAAPPAAAYPRKRFILSSPPQTVAGLQRLGVDVPLLANNHTRDLLDRGVADTRAALTAAGLPVVGFAGGDGHQDPYRTTVRGTGVALLGYTSVDGAFVNDQYPAGDAAAGGKGPDGQWQYDKRQWGFHDGRVDIPARERTVGDAWRVYSGQRGLDTGTATRLWESLVAVYPEMQDWVGRNGHEGAARWDDTRSPAEIRRAAAGATLTVVELHSGFQFTDASAEHTRQMARSAIDAGADIVIGHHPHVLQGVEWYKGHLIVYSLGNLVFDQDFLSTFASAFLRTVWDGDHLVEARLVPVEIDRYRPRPATGVGARRTLLGIWADSVADAQTVRAADNQVVPVLLTRDRSSRPARLRLDHGTAVVTADQPPEEPVPIGCRHTPTGRSAIPA